MWTNSDRAMAQITIELLPGEARASRGMRAGGNAPAGISFARGRGDVRARRRRHRGGGCGPGQRGGCGGSRPRLGCRAGRDLRLGRGARVAAGARFGGRAGLAVRTLAARGISRRGLRSGCVGVPGFGDVAPLRWRRGVSAAVASAQARGHAGRRSRRAWRGAARCVACRRTGSGGCGSFGAAGRRGTVRGIRARYGCSRWPIVSNPHAAVMGRSPCVLHLRPPRCLRGPRPVRPPRRFRQAGVATLDRRGEEIDAVDGDPDACLGAMRRQVGQALPQRQALEADEVVADHRRGGLGDVFLQQPAQAPVVLHAVLEFRVLAVRRLEIGQRRKQLGVIVAHRAARSPRPPRAAAAGSTRSL